MKKPTDKTDRRKRPDSKNRITFRLESDLYSALRARADALRVSESWLIKHYLYKSLIDSEVSVRDLKTAKSL